MSELTIPATESLQREIPDSLMLFGFWYRALPSGQVTRNRLHKAMLLEIPLVLDGMRQAVLSLCTMPVRTVVCRFPAVVSMDENVECSYHGWKFEAHSGQCQLIPSLTADQKLKVDRIYAGAYACEEHDDFIWVFIPESKPRWRRLHESCRAAISSAASAKIQ